MNKTWHKIFLLALVATYIILAVIKIQNPGVHFDEAIHVNAALGGIDQTFIFRKIGNLPVLLMPYVGALKSYLTASIFYFFGVSPLTIRLPMILLAAFGILLAYFTAKKYLGAIVALIATLLLALDPSFIALTRVDFGPVVIAFVARILALLLFWKFVQKARLKYLLALLLTLALGIYNKLDFIWFFNALVFAGTIIYFKDFKKLITSKKNRRRWFFVSIIFIGLTILAGYYLLISHHFNLFSARAAFSLNYWTRTQNVLGNLFYQLNGELFYNNAFGFLHTALGKVISWTVIVLIVISSLLVALDPLKLLKHKKEFWFFVLLFLGIFAQIFVTKKAVWPWHTFASYPFLTFIIAYCFYALYLYLNKLAQNKLIASLLLTALLAGLSLYNVWMYSQYIRVYDKPLYKVYWANEIYDLIDYTKASRKKFVSVDWGIHNQLIVFTGIKDKYFNASFILNNKKLSATEKNKLIEQFLIDPKHTLYILHTRHDSLFKVARDNFLELVDLAGHKPQKIKDFTDGQKIIFEIYKLI